MKKGARRRPLTKESKSQLLLGNVRSGAFPTGNSGRQMLHVLVSELGGGTGSTLVGTASRPSAIGYDQGALVLGQMLGKLLAIRCEGNCGRDMTLFVRTGTVYIDYSYLAILNGLLKFLNADIGKLTSEQSRGKEG